MADHLAFLLDVDNTLLDNDSVIEDLREHLTDAFGEELQLCYWELFEQLRSELGYTDYLGALQRFRAAYPHEPHLIEMSLWLVDYPFGERLYPGALEVVARLASAGKTVVLTDGDVVFQPRKVERSGIRHAVGGNVLIYAHKEKEIEDVERRFPAERYVLVDDKLWILAAFKEAWGDRIVTVWPRQGHYAHDPGIISANPPPDVELERTSDLLTLDLDRLTGAPGSDT